MNNRQKTIRQFLESENLQVINVGLELFQETFEKLDIPSTMVQWQPPAEGDEELMDILSKLQG